MTTKTFGLVEELIVATRDYLHLPYASREAAERARTGYHDAKERLQKAIEEEAAGGRS